MFAVRSGRGAADARDGGEGGVVGVGQGVQVLLGGGQLGVAEAVHDGFEVGSAGKQPGGVCVAQVVPAQVKVQAGGFDGGEPDPGAEGGPGDGLAGLVGEQQLVRPNA
jgi:hypothetical protein